MAERRDPSMSPAARRVLCAAAVLTVLAGPVVLPFLIETAGGRPLLGLAAVGLGALLVGALIVICRLLWPAQSAKASLVIVCMGFVLAVAAALVGFLVAFLITIRSDLCGGSGDGLTSAASIAEGTAYLIVGAWAFRRPVRVLWGWPIAVLAALAAAVIVQAIVPGGHGFCET
jgi:hypothetical protein